MLRVDPKTVMRWARGGKLSSIRGPGGHRRYSEREVRGFLSAWQGRLDTPACRASPGPVRDSWKMTGSCGWSFRDPMTLS
jgi:hypothetical protein